tara:strand:+ start:1577 stop:2515 length:939 start_codon:yes stop_codon:yes gene_type:complete
MNLITHNPVLLNEALEYLNIRNNLVYVDATFGLGGYTKEILKKNNCTVIAVDRDPDVQKFSVILKKNYKNKFKFILGKFGDLKKLLEIESVDKITGGIVADLGMSSLHLENSKRGFSIKNNGPLDMRMSKKGISAEYVINSFEEDELSKIFWNYGEEHKSRKIAKTIVIERKKNKISTTHDLANLIKKVKLQKKPYRIHPATKIFQALRIFINNELEEIKCLIDHSINIMAPGARLVLISFHSLEDRLIKNTFKKLCEGEKNVNRHLPSLKPSMKPKFKKIGKPFYIPTENEILKNPRSRSAKLRVIERVSI